MVLLTSTQQIQDTINFLSSNSNLTSIESQCLPQTISDPIDHQTLISLSKLHPTITLNKLLKGTRIYIPPSKPKPKPTPEYEALMKHLRAEQERKEYDTLISQGAKTEKINFTSKEDDEDDVYPSLVFNILLSIILCAGAAFYMTRYWGDAGVRVLVSLGVALVVGGAEAGVYAAYLRKVKISRVKERELIERKVIIPDEGPLAQIENGDDVEREEIWGRGINGGMRRRVRDRWEKDQNNYKPEH